MLCALTERKLKPGTYEQFRAAWEPKDVPEGWTRAYHLRSVEDPDLVISFGFFEGTLEELRSSQKEGDRQQQIDEIAPLVESIGVDTVFEVVEELSLVEA